MKREREAGFALVILSLVGATLPGPIPVGQASSPGEAGTELFQSLVSSSVAMAERLAVVKSALGFSSATALNDVRVTFDPNHLPQNEPSISINPSDQANLATGANDYRLIALGASVWLGVYISFDGGLNWSNQLIPGFPGDPTKTALSGFDVASDPSLAYDRAGNLYYAGLVFRIKGVNAADGSVFVSKSGDGGRSFPQTVLIAIGERGIFNDKPYAAVDNKLGTFRDRVYVSWTRFTSSTADIMVSYSADGGTSFSVPLKVSSTVVNQGSVPVVGPSGEVYVVWNDLSCRVIVGASCRIMAAKSTDGGASFSTPVAVSAYVRVPSPLPNSLFRVNSNPAAAVDDTNGNAYAAWADYRNDNADIMFSSSIDGGLTWSVPKRVNDDATTNDQFFPWMAVSAGRLTIDFYDRRLDPENHLIDVFFAESTDGGSTFSPNVRVSDVSSNPDAVLFSPGESFIGDYIGVASSLSSVHFVWTDLRNVTPSTRADQDIFADRLIFPAHDLAIKSLTSERTVVYEGVSLNPLRVTASVQNLGTQSEASVSVSFFANETLIGSAIVASLNPGSSATVTIEWNTNTLVKGVYVLSAQVAQVLEETNVANNVLTDGTVEVRLAGDVNGDGRVNLDDLLLVFANQGTTNLLYDVNLDGKVNLDDLLLVYVHQFTT